MDPMLRRVSALAVFLSATLPAASLSAQQARTFGSFRATTSIAFTVATTGDERHAAIAWRCMADGLNVIYLIGGPVGREMDRELAIGIVVDEREREPQSWTLLEGHRAVFLPRTSVEAFTRDALAAEHLSLRGIDPVSGTRFTDEFALDGLRGALQYILPCEF